MRWRALVLDDEPRYRDILRRVLEREGFSVRSAENGEDAVAQILQGEVDLLVTDLQMPKVTGLDLIELTSRLPHPPQVLLITAQKGMLEGRLKRFGSVHCLLKPFSLNDFRAKIGLLTGHWTSPSVAPVAEGEFSSPLSCTLN